MAPSRSRAQSTRALYDEDDSAEETERESTPKPVRSTGLRKRKSEVHGNDSLARSKTIVNNDLAEKRRRRQSTRVGEGTSGEGGEGDVEGLNRNTGRPLQQLDSVAPGPAPARAAPLVPQQDNYDEWMKLAMGNVSYPLHVIFFLPTDASENQCREHLGL